MTARTVTVAGRQLRLYLARHCGVWTSDPHEVRALDERFELRASGRMVPEGSPRGTAQRLRYRAMRMPFGRAR